VISDAVQRSDAARAAYRTAVNATTNPRSLTGNSPLAGGVFGDTPGGVRVK
jgi:hypothetical protein